MFTHIFLLSVISKENQHMHQNQVQSCPVFFSFFHQVYDIHMVILLFFILFENIPFNVKQVLLIIV